MLLLPLQHKSESNIAQFSTVQKKVVMTIFDKNPDAFVKVKDLLLYHEFIKNIPSGCCLEVSLSVAQAQDLNKANNINGTNPQNRTFDTNRMYRINSGLPDPLVELTFFATVDNYSNLPKLVSLGLGTVKMPDWSATNGHQVRGVLVHYDLDANKVYSIFNPDMNQYAAVSKTVLVPAANCIEKMQWGVERYENLHMINTRVVDEAVQLNTLNGIYNKCIIDFQDHSECICSNWNTGEKNIIKFWADNSFMTNNNIGTNNSINVPELEMVASTVGNNNQIFTMDGPTYKIPTNLENSSIGNGNNIALDALASANGIYNDCTWGHNITMVLDQNHEHVRHTGAVSEFTKTVDATSLTVATILVPSGYGRITLDFAAPASISIINTANTDRNKRIRFTAITSDITFAGSGNLILTSGLCVLGAGTGSFIEFEYDANVSKFVEVARGSF